MNYYSHVPSTFQMVFALPMAGIDTISEDVRVFGYSIHCCDLCRSPRPFGMGIGVNLQTSEARPTQATCDKTCDLRLNRLCIRIEAW